MTELYSNYKEYNDKKNLNYSVGSINKKMLKENSDTMY